MKTLVNLKDRDFIIEVVETFSNYSQIPRYICKCNGIQLTAAVNSIYKEIFQTNAKYLGPAVIIPIISEALLKDLPFHAFLFPLGKLNIWELEDDYCQVTIYSENELCNIYVDNNPELVWKKVAILQQYEGKELFGLENNKIQQLVWSTPSCTLEEWNDDDLCAWKSMLKNVGCTKITPFTKEQLECEFWPRSSAPTIDQTNLIMLYKQGFINLIPVHFQNKTQIFWDSFWEAVNINKNGYDGKTCILSIIAKKFSYEEIKSNLNMQEQLQAFLMDKAHVIMSSYKTDAATNKSVHYLKQTKTELQKKYHEQYPDGIQ
ncbi:hypothetical protein C1646_774297 [Rhizophagus diaphanus]|nr:hypothetical protein C1646_774297 [Rhizophagus diaphanus] [Rhizophagus sp. MUCL 43196]